MIENKADRKQIQLIHIAKSRLNIDDDTYREMLEYYCGVNSAKELTYNQAAFFIDLLKRKGFKPAAKKKPLIERGGKIVRLATKGQLALIEVLRANVIWQKRDGYYAWLEKRMGIKKVLTDGDAFKTIEGLKGMLKIDARIIRMKALPFPYTPEPKLFIDPKTGRLREYLWLFDTAAKRLICFNVKGGEERCLTAINT